MQSHGPSKRGMENADCGILSKIRQNPLWGSVFLCEIFFNFYPSSWCGKRELHPHDLFGRQVCWLLHHCRKNGAFTQTCTALYRLPSDWIAFYPLKAGGVPLRCRTARSPFCRRMGSLAPSRDYKWGDRWDSHPFRQVHSLSCCCYTTATAGWLRSMIGQPPWKLHGLSLYFCQSMLPAVILTIKPCCMSHLMPPQPKMEPPVGLAPAVPWSQAKCFGF